MTNDDSRLQTKSTRLPLNLFTTRLSAQCTHTHRRQHWLWLHKSVRHIPNEHTGHSLQLKMRKKNTIRRVACIRQRPNGSTTHTHTHTKIDRVRCSRQKRKSFRFYLFVDNKNITINENNKKIHSIKVRGTNE